CGRSGNEAADKSVRITLGCPPSLRRRLLPAKIVSRSSDTTSVARVAEITTYDAPESRMMRRVFPGLLCLAILTLGAFAGNPANPILFVTQVPMPDEVNSRTITVSTQSCVSPFGNQLADTGHAGRGGSLYMRFNAGGSNGAVYDLLALADWTAIAGGKPAAN